MKSLDNSMHIKEHTNMNKKSWVISIRTIYLYVFVFASIYLEFGYDAVIGNSVSGMVKTGILIFMSVMLFVINPVISKKSLVLFFYLFALIAIDSIRSVSIGDSILLIVPIFVGFIVSCTVDINQLEKAFSDIVYFLAGYSLVFYIIGYIFPALINKLPVIGYLYNSQAQMHNALFCVCSSGTAFLRNYGITWEPGAFAIILCLSLFIELFIRKDTKPIRAYVLVIAIITTYSTMGFFVLAGIMVTYLLSAKDNLKIKKSHIVLVFVVIILYVVFSSSDIGSLVFSKLNGLFDKGKELNYTTLARVNAIKVPFEAFCSSPILGIGCENFMVFNREYCDGVATNTIINWFASLGLLLGIPCLLYQLKFVCHVSKNCDLSFLGTCLIIISSVLLVSTESLYRISLIYVIVFYGIQHRKRQGYTDVSYDS